MKLTLLLGLMALFITSCVSKDQLKKTLVENPDILTEAIKENPKQILDALNQAVESAKSKSKEDQQKAQEQALEEEFKNPKKAEIQEGRVIFGKKDAPITVIEYSDFECPFCARGYNTVKEVMEKYGDKVRVVYKHLPLSFHPQAEPASRYFEAIALQSHEKAEKFHDKIFENQAGLKQGEKFLKQVAKEVGADVSKVVKDKDSKKVKEIIEADKAEAAKYGFSGTPGFLVNGVSVKGAYPFPHFKMIIDRHLEEEGS